jgi:tetratricopeptide (TPR) repeat protein
LLSFSGLKNYKAGNKRSAASDFLMAEDYFPLGLLELEFGEYGKAIASWKKLLPTLINDPNSYNNLLKNISIAMNLHDTNYAKEQLEEIDDVQEKTLRAFSS